MSDMEWVASVNPKGKTWYFNKSTGVSTFERPEDLEEEPPFIPASQLGEAPMATAEAVPVCLKCKAQGHFAKDCLLLYIPPPQEREPSPPQRPKPNRDMPQDRMVEPMGPPMPPYSLPGPYPYPPPGFGFPLPGSVPFGPFYGPPRHLPMPPYPPPHGPPPFLPPGPPLYPSPPPAPPYVQNPLPPPPPPPPAPQPRQSRKSVGEPQPAKQRAPPRKSRGSGSWVEMVPREQPPAAASQRSGLSADELQKQINHASARVEVLTQANAQRDGTIQVLQQQIKDIREHLDRLRTQTEEAQAERDDAYAEMETVLKQHEQERQTLGAQIFRGISEDDARVILTSEEFQRWYPTSWQTAAPATTEAVASPAYPPQPSPGPQGPYGPPMGYQGYGYGALPPYPYTSSGYGYPYRY